MCVRVHKANIMYFSQWNQRVDYFYDEKITVCVFYPQKKSLKQISGDIQNINGKEQQEIAWEVLLNKFLIEIW